MVTIRSSVPLLVLTIAAFDGTASRANYKRTAFEHVYCYRHSLIAYCSLASRFHCLCLCLHLLWLLGCCRLQWLSWWLSSFLAWCKNFLTCRIVSRWSNCFPAAAHEQFIQLHIVQFRYYYCGISPGMQSCCAISFWPAVATCTHWRMTIFEYHSSNKHMHSLCLCPLARHQLCADYLRPNPVQSV